MSTANPTIRRYPRTMREAFPGDPAYGCAITHTSPENSIGHWIGRAIGVVAMLMMAGSVWRWTQTPEGESVALADARTQAQHQARFDKAAKAMCHGDVAWIDTERGMVQCGKHKKVAP